MITFPVDAERPWCACCLEHRVEEPTHYFCAVCQPKPRKPFPSLPGPRLPENTVVQACAVWPHA